MKEKEAVDNTDELLGQVINILKENKGPLRLGEFRIKHGIDPLKMMILVNSNPETFTYVDSIVGRNPNPVPLIDLKERLDNRTLDPLLVARLFKILKASGKNGITTSRLWKPHGIPTKTTERFAKEHPDQVLLVQRADHQKRVRQFLVLKAAIEPADPPIEPPEAPPAIGHGVRAAEQSAPEILIDDNLRLDCARLEGILRDAPRLDNWLESTIAWSRVLEIDRAFPNLLEIYSAPNGWQKIVKLRALPVDEPAGESLPVKAEPEPWPEQPSGEELDRMKWSGGRRFGHRGRISTDPKASQYRERRPLIHLPK